MINFFRRIRQSLIEQNEMGKYLKYAIGEILLVVIGILIALGINNWNETRKTTQANTEFLNRLLTEVNSSANKIQKEIDIELNQIKACKNMLDMFHQESSMHKSHSIDSLISVIFSANTIDLNNGVLKEGINTGIIGTLKSEELRTNLYSFIGVIEDAKELQKNWNNDLAGAFGNYLFKNFNFRNMDNSFGKYRGKIGETYFTNFNSTNLLRNMEFENYLDNRYFTNNQQLEFYRDLHSELNKIKTLIKEELKK
jgi:hypothetical protein